MSALERQPTNKNFLSPIGFQFILARAPTVEYFCQAVTLPSVSIPEVRQPTPMGTSIPLPGDKIEYEPFAIRFRVDENMDNYLELLGWMESLTRPTDFDQYISLTQGRRVIQTNNTYSDSTIMILTSNKNANLNVKMFDCFPMSLTALEFDAAVADVDYLEASATFGYRRYELERVLTSTN